MSAYSPFADSAELLLGGQTLNELELGNWHEDPSWSTCQKMLNDPDFPAYLKQLPSQISCGRLRKKNFDASGRRFTDLQPFIEAQMANDIRCDCCAVKALFNWLSVVGTFYKVATGITERIGDSLGSTSLFDIISHAPTQFVGR